MKLTTLLLTLAGVVGMEGVATAQQRTVDFTQGIPQGMRSLAGNTLSLDTLRMKRGTQSLRWDWVGNDRLIYDTPIGYKKQVLVYENVDGHGGSATNPILSEPKSFAMWIYNTKATTQRMRIQFGRGEQVDCEFDYELNFTGWRTVLIGFDRGDMRGIPREDMDRLTILAPSAGSGTFYLDMINTATPVNPRIAAPSAQLPDIQIHPRVVSQYESRLYENSLKRPTFNLEPITAQDIQGFRNMEKRIDDVFFPSYDQATTKDNKIEGIRAAYNQYEIVREGDNIYGVPVMDGQVYEMYKDLNESLTETRKHTKTWNQDLTPLMFNIAKLYTVTQSKELKAELASKFVDLFDLAYDQGMAPGECLAWIHHYSYRMRPLFPAMYYMRDALKEAGRLDKAIAVCRFYSQFNMFYDSETVYNVKGRTATDADYLQGVLSQALVVVLMQEDSPEKLRDLKHYRDYFTKVSSNYANALDEALKPDGTTFHHAGHAIDYGGRALAGLVRAAYILGGTPYPVEQAVIDRIKKGILVTRLYSMGQDYSSPRAFASIRFNSYNLPREFNTLPAMLALSTPADETELASIFYQIEGEQTKADNNLTLWKNKLDERYASAPKTYDYTTNMVLPYSCVAMQRYKSDWLITVRGHNKYVLPFESWGPTFFRYPLYIANGYLDVTYKDNLDSTTPEKGLWQEGYDWNRWPGTTAVRLPFDQMVTNPGQVRDEPGEYLLSTESFSGGVSASYHAGIYVFPFRGHDKFGIQSFTGKKSYFFFNNKVLCLGTDITSGVAGCDVETTLFQNSLTHNVERQPLMKVGNAEKPLQQTLTQGKNIWFIDTRGTGYYLPTIAKGTTLEVKSGTQTNPQPVGEGECSGEFVTAVLNHGEKAQNVNYNYVMLADVTEEEMAAFAKQQSSRQPIMKVLQQDAQAHIVEIPEVDATAYAIYAPEGMSFKRGDIKSVSKQITMMTRTVEKNEMLLSIADPDLNIYDGQDDLMPDGSRCELSIYEREWFYWPSRPNTVQITLKGAWEVAEQPIPMETAPHKEARIVSSDSRQTIVEVECRDGLTAEFLLRKR